ncbi:MAG: hypothetical protein WKF90_03750 [Pyrinomonadaceae bacterium]
MYLKTKDFLIDRDTVTAARMSNRLDNFYDDLNRCKNSHCNQDNHRIRQENFLIKEADKILLDPNATRSEKAFAGIVYEIVRGFQEDIGGDNDEW